MEVGSLQGGSRKRRVEVGSEQRVTLLGHGKCDHYSQFDAGHIPFKETIRYIIMYTNERVISTHEHWYDVRQIDRLAPLADNFRGARAPCASVVPPPMFRYKPLPKTDTLLTIQPLTSYYEVAILLVNISMFGYHNNHGSRKSVIYRFSSTMQVRCRGIFYPPDFLSGRIVYSIRPDNFS